MNSNTIVGSVERRPKW